MATYTKVSRSIPSLQRVAIITDVAEGDNIDITDVLGRSARRVQFNLTDVGDQIEYRLNTMRKIRRQVSEANGNYPDTQIERTDGVFGKETLTIFSGTGDAFSDVGESILTADGISISSVSINALALSVGTTITITVW
jgi:hypothetical protein